MVACPGHMFTAGDAAYLVEVSVVFPFMFTGLATH